MKVSLAVVAALAASTSSLSLSILEPQILELVDNGPTQHFAPVHHDKQARPNGVKPPLHGIKPCHGAKPVHAGPSSYFPGPIGSLLSRLGFTPRERGDHRSHVQFEVVSALRDEVEAHRHMDAFKDRVEEMIHRVEEQSVPLMEGGIVKILPIFNEFGDIASPKHIGKGQADSPHFRVGHAGKVAVEDEREMRMIQWESMAGKDGIKAVHHKHHEHHGHHEHGYGHRHRGKSFGCRLNHALKSLRPAESLSLAFVIGAGIGSLLHLLFMVVLISVRRMRCGRGVRAKRRAERRAARAVRRADRAERKAARQGAKKDTKEGTIRLEDEEEGEVLPAYGEGEQDRLVESAEKV